MIAAELRLGNLVNTIVSDKPSIVTFIKSQKVKDGYYQSVELDEEEIYIPQHICGIPLTADILERAGFKKDENIQQDFSYILKAKARLTFVYYKGDKSYFSIEQDGKLIDLASGAVQYLHQLQNLYFALCSEELTINLLSASAAR